MASIEIGERVTLITDGRFVEWLFEEIRQNRTQLLESYPTGIECPNAENVARFLERVAKLRWEGFGPPELFQPTPVGPVAGRGWDGAAAAVPNFAVPQFLTRRIKDKHVVLLHPEVHLEDVPRLLFIAAFMTKELPWLRGLPLPTVFEHLGWPLHVLAEAAHAYSLTMLGGQPFIRQSCVGDDLNGSAEAFSRTMEKTAVQNGLKWVSVEKQAAPVVNGADDALTEALEHAAVNCQLPVGRTSRGRIADKDGRSFLYVACRPNVERLCAVLVPE